MKLATDSLKEEVEHILYGVNTNLEILRQSYQENSKLLKNFTTEVSQLASSMSAINTQFSSILAAVNGFSSKLNTIEVNFSVQLKQIETTVTAQIASVEQTLNTVNRHFNTKFADLSDQITRRFEENKVFQERRYEDSATQAKKIQDSIYFLEKRLSKNIKAFSLWFLLLFFSLLVGIGSILFLLNRNVDLNNTDANRYIPVPKNTDTPDETTYIQPNEENEKTTNEQDIISPEQRSAEQQSTVEEIAKLKSTENQPISEKDAQREKTERMAGIVMSAISRKNYVLIDRDLVHSGKGINFYTAGLGNENLMVYASSFANLMANPRIYDWGNLDSDGNKFRNTISAFFDQLLLKDTTIKNTKTTVNQITFPGLNNLSSTKIEKNFNKPLSYSEYIIDGRSLVFVFQKDYSIDNWYLIAIIHNQ
jgi:uncharacterized protein YoxC